MNSKCKSDIERLIYDSLEAKDILKNLLVATTEVNCKLDAVIALMTTPGLTPRQQTQELQQH